MRRRTRSDAGFTIIELAIVMTVIFILCAIAIPTYQRIVIHAREQTLRDDLRNMRKSIDQFTADKAKPPQALDDLVSEKYLPLIPEDPFTGSSTTWVTVTETDPLSIKAETGIVDVKSGSDEVDSTGEHTYSEW